MDGIEVGHMFSPWMLKLFLFHAFYFNIHFICKKENW